MQVTKETLDPCQVALTIEVEQDKVGTAVDRAYREYAKYVSVPGFRKGKAPLQYVRQRVAEADIRQRTAELLVESAYSDALKESNIEPYAAPKLELLQLELADKPFIFKAVVPLAPQVELGDYKGLNVERNVYSIEDADIDGDLQKLRERSAEYPKVDQPVKNGDLVIANVAAKTVKNPDAESKPTMVEIGSDNIPGFDDQLVGMAVGESKTFGLTYPADYPDEELQNTDVEFTVTVNEVRAKVLPALDDEFAKKISNGGMETLEALKVDLRDDMQKNLDQKASNELDAAIVDQVIANATIKYPPLIVEAEAEDDHKYLLDRLEQRGITFDNYLESTQTSKAQYLEELTTASTKRVEIGLVLGEISTKESLEATEADVDAVIAQSAALQNTTPTALRALLESNGGIASVRNRAQTKKVLDFLRDAAIIQDKTVVNIGADSDAAKPAKKAAPKKSTKTKESDGE